MENTSKNLRQRFKKYFGVILIVTSFLLWIPVVTFPFLQLPIGLKSAVIAVCVGLAEVCFWVGSLIVGKDVVKKFFKRSKVES